MMMPMMLDPVALMLTLALAAMAGIVHMWLKSTYAKYSEIPVRRGITGAQVAQAIMDREGIHDVSIECVGGVMTDHYDPMHKVVRLSEGVYYGTTIASLSIAAHEVGHVIQHARGYAPLALRTYIAPVCSIGSNFAPMLILFGLILSIPSLATAGLWLFAAATAFTLVTLPVEFNASSRALVQLSDGRMMSEDELGGARQMLNAAALTYVSAAVTAIAWLLYYVMLINGRRD
ncbi:MAG: hypothetical protein GC168_03310 [Candidatus Hydrogenedens sp.]|nr:hypothetical protein [Candidatus Hydrogenedens sp.]